ncbi:MAG: PadR family transcriptional regulator [Anaerolineaceae bacterium]|nr:PadR family transcriptional regulator [Anaerolineaceae bacterium]
MVATENKEELSQNFVFELRRGTLVLAVLSQLEKEQYGYDLMKLLEEKDLSIDQGTLYPLLRRLEKQNLLDSEWRVEESRPRRYYKINDFGMDVLHNLLNEWQSMKTIMENLI